MYGSLSYQRGISKTSSCIKTFADTLVIIDVLVWRRRCGNSTGQLDFVVDLRSVTNTSAVVTGAPVHSFVRT